MAICDFYLMSNRRTPNEPKVKTTWLLPKSLVKQLKQYALDNETTLTAVIIDACTEYFSKVRR
jgi:hypothetical protein